NLLFTTIPTRSSSDLSSFFFRCILRPKKNSGPCNLYPHGLAFAFAALREPRSKAFSEALGSQAEAGFDLSVSDRERVVEVGRVRKVAHAELIEPFKGAGARFPANHHA